MFGRRLALFGLPLMFLQAARSALAGPLGDQDGLKERLDKAEQQIEKLKDSFDAFKGANTKNEGNISTLAFTNPPIGTVVAYMGQWPPVDSKKKWNELELGWALCDGRVIQPTMDYLKELAKIDQNYEKSNPEDESWAVFKELSTVLGSTEKMLPELIMLPDLRGYFLRGIDNEGFSLQFMSVDDVKQLPESGRRLIVVALVGTPGSPNELHFRVFDIKKEKDKKEKEEKVVDIREADLKEQSGNLKALRDQLNSLHIFRRDIRNANELTIDEQDRVIDAVVSIVDPARTKILGRLKKRDAAGSRPPRSWQDSSTALPKMIALQVSREEDHTHATWRDGKHFNSLVCSDGKQNIGDGKVLDETPAANKEPNLAHCEPMSWAGGHSHQISGGDPETRPANVGVHWIIKFR